MQALIDSTVAMSVQNPLLLATVAFLAAAAEAVVVVGAVVPGTAILLGIAAIAGAKGSASIGFAVLAAAALGAVAGDGLGFWLGRHYGRGLATVWPLSRHPQLLPRGEAYFARHGGASVFWGRFIPGVKTVVPMVAGLSGMRMAPFLAANLASAVLWSLGLVLGGLGIGRGLARFGLADPRFLVLLAVLALGLALAYLLLRGLLLRGMPVLARLRGRAMGQLAARRGRSAAALLRVLVNEGGAAAGLVWAAVSAAAVIGFLLLLGQVVFDPGFARADALLSNAAQALRFGALDAVMVAVTMAGDGIVLAALATAALLWLLACREWRAAGAAALAFTATMLFVPLFKGALGRERPFPLYTGSDSFSFPSGHASHAMVVFGVVGLLLAHRLAFRGRLAVYFAAFGLALLVAFSRIYLGAHWPSDVAGGLLFGAAIIAAVGFALRDRPLAIRPGWMALGLLVVYGAAYGLHVDRGYARWTANYTHAPEPVALSPAAWRDGGWTALPSRRATLEAPAPQPFLAQYAGDPQTLVAALVATGWSVERAGPTSSLASMLLPFGRLGDLTPELVLHDGRLPAATLVRPQTLRRRLVLRIWPSDAVLDDGTGPPAAIQLVDIAAETFTPVALGFGDLESALSTPAEAATVRARLAAAPGLAAASGPDAAPLLLRAASPAR